MYGCQPNSSGSYTEAYQTHEDCGYGYNVVCRYDDEYTKPTRVYIGVKMLFINLWKRCYMK